MVIDLSVFVREKGWYISILMGAGVFSFFYFKKRSRAMRHWLDRLSLRIPIIGSILQKAAIARYARTLSTMFAAGVPLVEALQSVAGATGNIVYEVGVLKMRDEVSTGQRLQIAMENTNLFPNMVIQMIAVGEESGSLDNMSSKVADFYEEDVDNAVDNLSSLLEPLIMSILGVLGAGKGVQQAHRQADPEQGNYDRIGNNLVIDVDHADRDEYAGQPNRHQGFPAEAEMPGANAGERGSQYLDQGITDGNRRLAGGTFRTEHQVAQNGYILPGLDISAAGPAMRARGHEIETALGQVGCRFAHQFVALLPPLALHHERQPENDHIEKTADQQRESERYRDKKCGRLS